MSSRNEHSCHITWPWALCKLCICSQPDLGKVDEMKKMRSFLVDLRRGGFNPSSLFLDIFVLSSFNGPFLGMIGLDIKNAAHQCISFITTCLKNSASSGEVAAFALPSDHSLSLGWDSQGTKTTSRASPSCLQGCASGAGTVLCVWGCQHSSSTSDLS